MSTVLLLTTGTGPAEGLLLQDLRDSGHVVDVLDVASHAWLRRRPGLAPAPLYPWTGTHALRAAGAQIAREMRRVTAAGAYDAILASGLGAAGFAARHVEEEFIPLLRRGDLDFSAARRHAEEDFAALTRAVDRLFLADEWEFDKALSKGSRSAHLRHPRVGLAPQTLAPLAAEAETPRVVVLHPEHVDADRLAAQMEALQTAVDTVPGASLRSLSASALYRTRDLAAGRAFDAVAATRLGGATHVVLVGSSRDHAAVGELLVGTGFAERLVVEDTIGSGAWAAGHPGVRTGRGLRLVTELAAALHGGPETHSAVDTVDGGTTDLLSAYRAAMTGRVDRTFEDLAVLRHDGPLDVFFSTSPLEDRTDGARPQRVRNMNDALSEPAAALRLSSVPGVFDRRLRVLDEALAAGRPLGLLYGENSTSPIPVGRVTSALADVMARFSAGGGTSVWFVRDLHWLDEIDGYLEDADARRDVQERGLAEFDAMAAAADRLAAPSAESGAGFDALLARHGRGPVDWLPLPPAVSPANTVPADAPAIGEEGVTLLYAGGVGGIYGLGQYLTAVGTLDPQVRLDFVVRAGERSVLEDLLAEHGLADRPGLRITTVPLEWYVPATRTVVGVVLLGGEYARFSFPYKTMSLIERGYPVLCFADMGIADFLERNRVGLGVARSSEAIRAGIAALVRDGAPGMAEAQRSQSWAARVATARASAED
ncbi:hypothetical protein ACH0BH_04185 [Micrococcus luteus]|uniref:hypothetical protein n=2 Tax=Micrococcus TaxID=1269 RepID=UPI000EFCBC52|nr:hypothetical protein [Micrococcus luteus]AYO49422.1 hypothetical protein FMM_03050 [Micrococcus luteus]MCT2066927.1 hypothetical protein [Micrococcus luteus]MDK8177870.1 hypothetical protein [Micrococcus luteus]MPZ01407.1 glycosyltransferase family 4 protein [Micrococcus luteus]RZB22840.1 hypothetical protein EU554_02105 [Micrococcus luteus]